MLFIDLFVQIYERFRRLDRNNRKYVLLFEIILPNILCWLQLSFELRQIAYPILYLVHNTARIYLKCLTLLDYLWLIWLFFLTSKASSYLCYG